MQIGGEPVARESGEGDLAYFIRDNELRNQRRRTLGQQFWHANPGDKRRFYWLVATVHLPPLRPTDAEAWAKAEAELRSDYDGYHHELLRDWSEIYPRYREEFWSAEEVSDDLRRLLWIGEIEAKVVRLCRASFRVEANEMTNLEELAKEVQSFAQRFPSPISEMDRDPFERDIWYLVNLILAAAHHIALDSTARVDFHKSITTGIYRNVHRWKISDAQWDSFLNGTHEIPTKSISDATNSWSELRNPFLFTGAIHPPSVPIVDNTRIARFILQFKGEIARRKFWSYGQQIWDAAPLREERLHWLQQVNQYFPRFSTNLTSDLWSITDAAVRANISLDAPQQLAAQKKYEELRRDVWESPLTTHAEKGLLRSLEVRRALMAARRGGESSREDVLLILGDIHELWRVYDDRILARRMAANVVASPASWGIRENDIDQFLTPMLDSDISELRALAEGWFRTRELRAKPLQFAAPRLSGELFDVEDLRGNIVLLDFWTTSCSACIEAMPRIHDIYKEYRSRGFEVVSVNFDADRNRKRVERIEEELGLTWTTLNAENQWGEANARFGWGNILPVYMLLNREGKLVAGTEEIEYGRNLRQLLDEMLAAEAAGIDAATIH